MSPRFEQAFRVTIDHEGGFQAIPDDPGNWFRGQLVGTKFGLSARSYGHELDIPSATIDDARRIYHRDFWEPIGGDSLPDGVAFAAFDGAINCGLKRSIRWLQEAAGTVPDGIVGPVTRRAVHAAVSRDTPDHFLRKIVAQRILHYARLETFDTFGTGWVMRGLRVLDDAQAFANQTPPWSLETANTATA